jgi:hypothetical protein
MREIFTVLLLGVAALAAVLLLGPYEAYLETAIAFVIVAAVVVGFLLYPRREVFFVTTAVSLIRPDRNWALEHDLLAVKVELARLWLLFVPTFLAMAALVFFIAGGPTKFSALNWLAESRFVFIVDLFGIYPPLLVLVLLSAWIQERKVMRDAEACSARSFTFSHSNAGLITGASYLFMGEGGEYYGGACRYFGWGIRSHELKTIVFYNVRKPEVNKIAMGLLFHRVVVLGRGVTDLDQVPTRTRRVMAPTVSAP